MKLKGLLLGSALAIASQSGAETKNLTCPSTSPLVDNLGIVKAATKTKIENRLNKIDSEMHHQVVVVTVNSLEEYGYGSMMEMANALGKECGVGYRGEDTGVVVLYTKAPSKYRINPAATQRYITDAISGRILDKSKSAGVCAKEDVDCRLDFITGEIDKVIREQFKAPGAVEPLKEATRKFDKDKLSKRTSELMGNLGMGAILIVVLGGAGLGVTKVVRINQRNSRRKDLKKEIFELNAALLVEKQKYPEWFQKEYISKYENALNEMMGYSDEDLNNTLESQTGLSIIKSNMSKINEQIESWESVFTRIMSNRETFLTTYDSLVTEVTSLKSSLEKKGFKLGKINITKIDDTKNPVDVIAQIKNASEGIASSIKKLKGIESFYSSMDGFDKDIYEESTSQKKKYDEVSEKYVDIYTKTMPFDFIKLDKGISDLFIDFSKIYAEKDIDKLESIQSKSKSLFITLKKVISDMQQKIDWYDTIPSLVMFRRTQLKKIEPNNEYVVSSQSYMNKTGKRDFQNFDMGAHIVMLTAILDEAISFHSQKTNLDKVTEKFSLYDKGFSKMEEYMGLGVALAAILAQEAAAIERERINEERRKQQEIEDEERRKKKKQDDEEEKARKKDDSNNDDNGWKGGGGDGFDGAGAESD